MATRQNGSQSALYDLARKTSSRHDMAACQQRLLSHLEDILISRSESVVLSALAHTPVPALQRVLRRTEAGLQLRMASAHFSARECESLINQTLMLMRRLPRMTLLERIEVTSARLIARCMHGEAHLSVKNPCLRLLSSVHLLVRRHQPASAALMLRQQFLLSCLLHEPHERIATIWRHHLFWFHFNYARRLLHLENRPESGTYLSAFYWPDQDDYVRLIRGNTDSRVLVSIHMGDFFGAFRVISAVSESGRNAISLRRDNTANHGMQHFSADRISHAVLSQRQQPAAIVSALRQGGHTLAVLFDLREDFGNTVPVTFFGQPARFVRGPAQLAIMGRSHIYPFVSFVRQGQNCIEMAPVIDTRLRQGENLHQATQRITQVLVSLAEGWIRQWPEQWKYLDSLPAYFEMASRDE